MDALFAPLSISKALWVGLGLVMAWLLSTTLLQLTRPRKGPFAWPLIGAFPQVMWNYHRYHDWVSDLYEKYGGTVTVPIPFDSLTYVANPQCIEYMLKTNFNNYPKGDRDRDILLELLGGGIFNADGQDWALQRKTAAHEFSVKKLREHATVVFQEEVVALVEQAERAAEQGTVLDLQDLLMRLTLESICHVGFGLRLGLLTPSDGSQEAAEFARAFDLANQVAIERFVSPGIWKVKRFLGIGGEGQMKRAQAAINRFANKVIQRRREELAATGHASEKSGVQAGYNDSGKPARDTNGNRNGNGDRKKKSSPRVSPEASDDSSNSDEEGEENKRHGGSPNNSNASTFPSKPRTAESAGFSKPLTPEPLNPEPQDLLTRFMSMRDASGAPYPDVYLRDVILNFIIAGRDTSVGALTWLFYELSEDRHVEEKLFQELMGVLGVGPGEGGRVAERLTFEKLRKLTYLQAALSEALRLHPSVPQSRKTAVSADVLPDGTRISPGQFVVWTAYTMGRQESIWGADAAAFRPERWLTPDGSFRAESTYKFLAFQGGPRVCLGRELAFLEMKAAAAALIYNFRFQVVPGHRVTYGMALTLPVKGGLPVSVTRRWG